MNQQYRGVPPVAIGMPVYNGERYLEATLDSVLHQTYPDFTLFIADNASLDRTEEICRDYASKDSRIRYIRNPRNLGASRNYSICFNPARSEYFRWQNADDPIEPRLVELCVDALNKYPDVVLAYGKTRIIDEHGHLIEDYEDHLDLKSDSPSRRFMDCMKNIGLQNLMYGLIRRDALARTALLGNYVAADINLIIELSLYGKFHEIPVHLFNRRMHPQASSWERGNAERQRNFWDPSKRKMILQTWRSMYEFCKAVSRAPIPFRDKRILAVHLIRRAYWHKGPMRDELVNVIKYGLLKRP